MGKSVLVSALAIWLAGCSSSSSDTGKTAQAAAPQQAVPASSNPAAKYLELVGFRMKEKGAGKLEVTFGVVNHSEADLGDLSLHVDLRTINAKPGDPPVCSFTTKIPSVGPDELKEVSAIVPTKLRVYELPDWQFLKPDFQIVEPK
jgi:hypothetical protein